MVVWNTFAVSLSSVMFDISFIIVTVCFYVDRVYVLNVIFNVQSGPKKEAITKLSKYRIKP